MALYPVQNLLTWTCCSHSATHKSLGSQQRCWPSVPWWTGSTGITVRNKIQKLIQARDNCWHTETLEVLIPPSDNLLPLPWDLWLLHQGLLGATGQRRTGGGTSEDMRNGDSITSQVSVALVVTICVTRHFCPTSSYPVKLFETLGGQTSKWVISLIYNKDTFFSSYKLAKFAQSSFFSNHVYFSWHWDLFTSLHMQSSILHISLQQETMYDIWVKVYAGVTQCFKPL